MHSGKLRRRTFLALGGAALAQGAGLIHPAQAQSAVRSVKSRAAGYSFYLTTVDLTDPKTFLTIALPKNAPQANTQQRTYGAEPFPDMVKRLHAAVVANGTFFGKDGQQAVMGNMVGGGRFLKYSQWENFGTTLGLRVGNRPEMITARADGIKPQWQHHWFSITCGPRLLRQGEVWLNPSLEGFRDPNVLGVAARTAIGFSQDGQRLMLVNFDTDLSLKEEANVMKAIGCYEAMNLDGGASRSLAASSRVLVPAGRSLTNVIAIYDSRHPATTALQQAWARFQLTGQVE